MGGGGECVGTFDLIFLNRELPVLLPRPGEGLLLLNGIILFSVVNC